MIDITLKKKVASIILATIMVLTASGFISTGTEPMPERVEPTSYPIDGWERLANIPEPQDHQSHFGNYTGPRAPGLVYILVQPELYRDVGPQVDRYMADIIAEGYAPELHTEGWQNANDVKSLLQTGYARDLRGAFFVGDIPHAMFEIYDDFGEPGNYALFPIELFFMDMDGSWSDADKNGILDTHADGLGDLEPEIWIGRLYASTVTIEGETDISMIQHYFDKNHEYRMGNLSLPEKGLVFVDDDWCSWTDYFGACLGFRYGNVTEVGDPERTTALEYKWNLYASH